MAASKHIKSERLLLVLIIGVFAIASFFLYEPVKYLLTGEVCQGKVIEYVDSASALPPRPEIIKHTYKAKSVLFITSSPAATNQYFFTLFSFSSVESQSS